MAGYVVRRRLEKPAPHTSLVKGTQLWRWEEGESTPQKLLVQVDKDGFYLFARSDDKSKEATYWDLALVSDVRAGKVPKDHKVQEPISADIGQLDPECCVTLVYRRDGIINLTTTNFVAPSPSAAQTFRKSVNELAHHVLDGHFSLHTYFSKLHTRTLLHANGHGHLSIKTLTKLLMLRSGAKDVAEYLMTHRITKQEETVEVEKFTLSVFLGMVDKLLQSRGPDLDVIKKESKIKPNRQYFTVAEFQTFLNETQRDPRLNEILHPRLSKEQVVTLVEKYGSGNERLNLQSLMSYLISDDNVVLNPEGADQHMDMSQPLNYYFINSSHNTYLNGGQLRSESLTEMYSQTLLCGCRCLELDCWPSDDKSDVIITHGNTFCTKVPFQDCVEAINEFAFVSSDYPVILSIENHCNRYPNLIEKMASTFVNVFGDKLQFTPFDDFALEPGVQMPPLERLKRKILIKDKVRRPGKGGGAAGGTLQRGATITIEEPPQSDDAAKKNGNGTKNGRNGSESGDSVSNAEASPSRSDSVKAAVPKQKSLLVQRPSLLKGMTILEEPVDTDAKVATEARGTSVITEEDDENAENKEETDQKEKSEKEEEEKPKETTEDDSKPTTPATPATPATSTAATPKKEKYETGGVLDSGPLSELLNYATAISFVSFETSEKMNCHYVMSSFNEEKGLNLIKTVPKDFVRYNGRQNSRVYPTGSRINSSNYMPQIYWNVGCQMVALNFQTPDLPMQINNAKFELNGGTGYILKPWVMCADKGFNPFVQKKIEDIVPCRLRMKVISGLFLTEKRTNLVVEAEMYGLPADTVRRQYTKKKGAAPHPMWNEDYFVFKRILLPEMALLRLSVLDDDHTLVGQRTLPMNHLRAGFRHISLRDKHNQPLGAACLFVHIKVEDYVPDEMEEFVAALMDPLSFASSALLALAEGTGVEGESEEPDGNTTDGNTSVTTPRTSVAAAAVSTTPRPSLGGADDKKSAVPPELMTQNKAVTQAFKGARPSTQDDTLPFIQAAKHRPAVIAVKCDSSVIIEHSDYLKMLKKSAKQRVDLSKKLDKVRSSLQSKQAKEVKGKVPADKIPAMKEAHAKALAELEAAHSKELREYDMKALVEKHEKQKFLVTATHKAQRAGLDKVQQGDIKQVNTEVLNEMKKKRKSDDYSMKDGKRFIHEEMVRMGTSLRSDLDNIHRREMQVFEKSQVEAVKEMNERHQEETDQMKGSESEAAALT